MTRTDAGVIDREREREREGKKIQDMTHHLSTLAFSPISATFPQNIRFGRLLADQCFKLVGLLHLSQSRETPGSTCARHHSADIQFPSHIDQRPTITANRPILADTKFSSFGSSQSTFLLPTHLPILQTSNKNWPEFGGDSQAILAFFVVGA